MKKTLLLTALTVALVLIFASTAMANTFISWDPSTPNGNLGPHTGYITTSEKCAVCHSVHNAPVSGDTTNGADPNSAVTQLLLASSVANACNYCHIQTSTGGVQIYGGDVTNYTSNDWGHSTACTNCHAVHGANTFQGFNKAKILRVRSDRPIQAEIVGTGNAAVFPIYANSAAAINDGASTGGKYYQQMAFCSQCHHNYSDSADATIANRPGRTPANFKTHAMVSPSASFDATHAGPAIDANGGSSGARTAGGASNIGAPVAYVGSNTCRSCHDAGNVNEAAAGGVSFNSFPHYTVGYPAFLKQGAAKGSIDASSQAALAEQDGSCLKCHVDTGGVAGVNVTF